MRHYFLRTAYPDLPSSKFIFQPRINALDCGPLPETVLFSPN